MKIQLNGNCAIELLFIINLFLHEVGHWVQHKDRRNLVESYIEWDKDIEEANYKETAELNARIRSIANMQHAILSIDIVT